MPIDFFVAPCSKIDGNCKKPGIICKNLLSDEEFGISDSNANNRKPAFVDLSNEELWDIIIENPNRKEITFKAIDFCIEIFRIGNYLLDDENRDPQNFLVEETDRLDNGPIKRCECFLLFDKKILFIELKKRKRGNWLKDAREKFEETILSFKQSHPNTDYILLDPIVSNKLHTGLHQNEMVQKRILKDKTGLDFHYKTSITI